jgi:hypothetical protein
VPIDNKKINKSLWVPMIEKLEKWFARWQGGFLSLGGRLTLLNNCLSNVPLYMLSIYPAPKPVIRKIDILRRRLLWQGGHQSKKNHLVDWLSVCSPKSQGGLGVLNLDFMNDSLMTKWLWNIETSNVLWQKIIASKYIKGNPLF